MRAYVIALIFIVGVNAVKVKVEKHVEKEVANDDGLEEVWEAQAKYVGDLVKDTFELQSEIFRKVDSNGNGEITLDELEEQLPKGTAPLFMKIADENNDGYLTRDEFWTWTNNHQIAFGQQASKEKVKGIFDFGKYKEDAEKILGDGTTSDADLWRAKGMKGHQCDSKFWAAAAKEWSNRYPKSAEHNQRHRYKSWTKDRFNGNYLQLFLPRSISLIGANPLDTCANILPLQKVAELGMSPDFFNWLGCYLKEAPKVYGDDFAGATGLVDPKSRMSAVKVATFYKQYHAGTKHDC